MGIAVGLAWALRNPEPSRPDSGLSESLAASEAYPHAQFGLVEACSNVSSPPQQVVEIVSPGELVLEDGQEVRVDIPYDSSGMPPGSFLGIGVAFDGVGPGDTGILLDESEMDISLDNRTRLSGPGRWPIVVAYRPLGEGRLIVNGVGGVDVGGAPREFLFRMATVC